MFRAGAPADTAASASVGTVTEPAFRIVGYVTDTGPLAAEDQLAQLTHVNYAFALPRPDGTLFEIANDWKLDGYVETAHRHGGKVLISVGGWGWDEEFEALAASDETRATFVAAIVALVESHGPDGADIDWEYPDPGASSQAFTALMSELRAALPAGALLTAAVAALGSNADGVAEDVFALVDFLNVMAYDGEDPEGHSPMGYADDALAYWSGRGLAAEKTVLGVPFYSRPQEVAYRDLVEADPRRPSTTRSTTTPAWSTTTGSRRCAPRPSWRWSEPAASCSGRSTTTLPMGRRSCGRSSKPWVIRGLALRPYS